jgi:hypothetical protein
MENLTHELSPAAIRQIEREARRAQAEGVCQFVVAPLARMIARLFTSARPGPATRAGVRLGTANGDTMLKNQCGLTAQTEIGLARGNLLRVENARNMRVGVERGTLWITQEDDPSDVVLERGESFQLDRDGLALLLACGGAAQTLISLAPAV